MIEKTIERTINGQPASIPKLGFVYRGHFYGRAFTPFGCIGLRLPFKNFCQLLEA